MLRGVYTSATGMEAQKDMQDLIADNLANTNTSGFKAMRHIYKNFAESDLISSATRQNYGKLSHGVEPYNTDFDLSQGALVETGNPLDIAIQGKGFFAVQNITGQIGYTRNGRFTIDKDGYVSTTQGDLLLDAGSAPIYIGVQGIRDLTVLRNGSIVMNGDIITQLNTYEFPDGVGITRIAGDKFVPSHNVTMTTSNTTPDLYSINTTIMQGFIEGSNVSSIKTATEMVQVTRTYEANQKALKAQMDTLQMLMDIGNI